MNMTSIPYTSIRKGIPSYDMYVKTRTHFLRYTMTTKREIVRLYMSMIYSPVCVPLPRTNRIHPFRVSDEGAL